MSLKNACSSSLQAQTASFFQVGLRILFKHQEEIILQDRVLGTRNLVARSFWKYTNKGKKPHSRQLALIICDFISPWWNNIFTLCLTAAVETNVNDFYIYKREINMVNYTLKNVEHVRRRKYKAIAITSKLACFEIHLDANVNQCKATFIICFLKQCLCTLACLRLACWPFT